MTDRDRLLALLNVYLRDMDAAMGLLADGWTKEAGFNVTRETRLRAFDLALGIRNRLKAEFDRPATCDLDEHFVLPALRGACARFNLEPDFSAEQLHSMFYDARIDITYGIAGLTKI